MNTMTEAPKAVKPKRPRPSKEVQETFRKARIALNRARLFIEAAECLAFTGKPYRLDGTLITDASYEDALYTASNALWRAREAIDDLRRKMPQP